MPYNAAFSFQPQSTWGGLDYYRAHALNPEPSLYEDAWGRVRDRNSIGNDSLGVGMDEARHSHRRAYEMPGEINCMAPVEIGQAAAYEAYKTWLRDSAIYEIVGERERQREGLVGIAVAEVTRLLQFSHRQVDRYSQSVAADAAAHTVTALFYQGQDDYPRSRSRSRMRAASYAGSHMLDPMSDDIWPQRSRSRSVSRSRSRHRHYSASPPRHRSRSRMYGDYPTMGGISPSVSYSSSYGGYPSSQSGYNVPYSPGHSWAGAPPISPSMMSNAMYPSSYPVQPMPVTYPGQPITMGTPYQTSLYNAHAGAVVTSRHNSISYPGMSYPGTSWGTNMGVPAQPTVVILESKRKHRHK